MERNALKALPAKRGHFAAWSMLKESGFSRSSLPVLLFHGNDILEANHIFSQGSKGEQREKLRRCPSREKRKETGNKEAFSFLLKRLLTMGFAPRLLERKNEGEPSEYAKIALSFGVPLQKEMRESPLEEILLRFPSRFFLLLPASACFIRECGLRLLLQEMGRASSCMAFSGGGKSRLGEMCQSSFSSPYSFLRPKSLQGEDAWPVAVDKAAYASSVRGAFPLDVYGAEVEVGDLSGSPSFASFFSLDVARLSGTEEFFLSRLFPEEAWSLLSRSNPSKRLLSHSLAVAKASAALALLLANRGLAVDAKLAASAGILHDLAKGYSRHELCGAAMLDSLGLHALAYCIRDHRDLLLPDSSPVTEREIVYLADKWCSGGSFVEIERRFGEKASLFSSSPLAVAAVGRRLSHAKALESRIARELGIPPAPLVRRAVEAPLDRAIFGSLIAEDV